jgi:hypothetical protein
VAIRDFINRVLRRNPELEPQRPEGVSSPEELTAAEDDARRASLKEREEMRERGEQDLEDV